MCSPGSSSLVHDLQTPEIAHVTLARARRLRTFCSAHGSHSVAIDLNNVPDLGNVDKLVDQALTIHLGEDASLVVVPAKKMAFKIVFVNKKESSALNRYVVEW